MESHRAPPPSQQPWGRPGVPFADSGTFEDAWREGQAHAENAYSGTSVGDAAARAAAGQPIASSGLTLRRPSGGLTSTRRNSRSRPHDLVSVGQVASSSSSSQQQGYGATILPPGLAHHSPRSTQFEQSRGHDPYYHDDASGSGEMLSPGYQMRVLPPSTPSPDAVSSSGSDHYRATVVPYQSAQTAQGNQTPPAHSSTMHAEEYTGVRRGSDQSTVLGIYYLYQSQAPSYAPTINESDAEEEGAPNAARPNRLSTIYSSMAPEPWTLSLDSAEVIATQMSPSSQGRHKALSPTPHGKDRKPSSVTKGVDQSTKKHTGKPKGASSKEKKAKPPPGPKKSKRFWFIMAALMTVTMLTAIDMNILATALPTVVAQLPSSTVPAAWITSAFLLTVTATQPLMGGLADVLGRRDALILSVIFFIAGSIVCALANSILILVVGRGLQGVGGGGIQALAEIILSDLTSLRERGTYVGIISLIFAVSTFVSPVLGGVFSAINWRWIFWINVPIGGLSLAIIIPSMKLKTPQMPLRKKIQRMDIPANILLLGSAISLLIAITEGGSEYPWTDIRIILTLAFGASGLVAFFLLEFLPNPIAPEPVLPPRLFSNRTAGCCFLLSMLHGMATYGGSYIIPLFFQAIKGSSPLKSAIESFPSTATGAPFAILAGVAMAITGKYKSQIIFWWAMMVVGFGMILLWSVDTPAWLWVFAQLLCGIPIGALFTLTLPPIQASLQVKDLAAATACYVFMRSLGSVFGIALVTSIFAASAEPRLAAIPGTAEVGLRGGTAMAFATELGHLPAAMQPAVRQAFMDSIHNACYFFLPVNALGLAVSFFVKSLPLPTFNESEHGLAGEKGEVGIATTPKLGEKHHRASTAKRSSGHARQRNSSSRAARSQSYIDRPDDLGIDLSNDVDQGQGATPEAAAAMRAKKEAYFRSQRRLLESGDVNGTLAPPSTAELAAATRGAHAAAPHQTYDAVGMRSGDGHLRKRSIRYATQPHGDRSTADLQEDRARVDYGDQPYPRGPPAHGTAQRTMPSMRRVEMVTQRAAPDGVQREAYDGAGVQSSAMATQPYGRGFEQGVVGTGGATRQYHHQPTWSQAQAASGWQHQARQPLASQPLAHTQSQPQPQHHARLESTPLRNAQSQSGHAPAHGGDGNRAENGGPQQGFAGVGSSAPFDRSHDGGAPPGRPEAHHTSGPDSAAVKDGDYYGSFW